jgi:DNA-binding NarL/FixJ family response regulator
MTAEGAQEPHIQVALVERTRMGGQMLCNLLRRDRALEVTDATSNASHVLAGLKPEVAIISAQLEDDPLKGFSLVEALNSSSPETKVVILLDRPDRHLVIRAFRLKARGIFCRCDPLHLLAKCVHKVRKSEIWANSEMVEMLIRALAEAPIANVVTMDGEQLLSSREQQVVRFVAEGLSNREIASRMKLSEHTIKNYLFRIYNKLGISSRVELVLYASSQQQLARSPR